MIIRARIVVTMDGPPVESGAVIVAGDRIVDVGRFSDVAKAYTGEQVVDLGEQALLPGLINAHCHLDYTCLRDKIPRQKSFTDWISSINAAKAKLSPGNYVASINDGFAEARRFGTTTIANLTAFPELVPQIESPIRTLWFAELIDVRDPSRAREIVDHAIEQLRSQKHWGLAPHAPFTASRNLYRRCEEIAEQENVLLTTHLGESREEKMMFRHARGSLYEFLKEIGRDMGDCGDATPAEHFFGKTDPANSHYLLVHLNEISDNDFDLLKGAAQSSSIAHCPRSHQYFDHSPFQFEKLQGLGFNICLGTDSLASNDNLSLFAEMRAFQEEFPKTRPERILEMVTVNPAAALRQSNSIGKIQRDFFADMIAMPITRSESLFEEMIAFDRSIAWSMAGGRISP